MYEMTNFQMKLELFKRRHINNYYPIYRCNFPINLESYILPLYSISQEVSIKLFIFTLFFFKVRKDPLKRTALTKIYFLSLISLSPKLIMGNHKFHILDKDYRDKILSRNKNTERISKELGTSHCCF